MTGEIRVDGLRELQRAFKTANKDLAKEMRSSLRSAAEPVRREAEARTVREIRNIGTVWDDMRTGVLTNQTYVAPRRRRKGGSPRPNLAGLLMERAMQPALDANARAVEAELGDMLDSLANKWER